MSHQVFPIGSLASSLAVISLAWPRAMYSFITAAYLSQTAGSLANLDSSAANRRETIDLLFGSVGRSSHKRATSYLSPLNRQVLLRSRQLSFRPDSSPTYHQVLLRKRLRKRIFARDDRAKVHFRRWFDLLGCCFFPWWRPNNSPAEWS